MDAISLKRIELLHPLIREKVKQGLARCEANGVNIRIAQGLRTFIEQDGLYAIGRTVQIGARPVTWAVGGMSYHNYGLAFDFCLLHDNKEVSWNMLEDLDHDKVADWMEVVTIFKSLGFEWGGTWPKPKMDTPHFEMTFGKTVRELLAMHNAKQVDKAGYVVLLP